MRKRSSWIEEKSFESMKTKLNRSSSVLYQSMQRSNTFSKKPGSFIISTNNNSMITLQPFMNKHFSQDLRSQKGSLRIEYNAINVHDRKIIRGVSFKIRNSEKNINPYPIDGSPILSQMKVTKILVPLKAKMIEQVSMNRDNSYSSFFSNFREKRKPTVKSNNYNANYKNKHSLCLTNRLISQHHQQLFLFKEHLKNIIEKNAQTKKSQYFYNKNIKGFSCSKNGNKRKTQKSSTLLIKTNQVKENLLKKLLLNHQSNSFTSTIKQQSLAWIWSNKSLLLERLIFNYTNYKWFLDKNKLMTPQILSEFISLLKMEKDDEFIKGVFMIFDPVKVGTINIQEVFLNFILTSSSSYQINISHILELLQDSNRTIVIIQFIELLKFVIPKSNLRKLAEILNQRFSVFSLETPRASFNALYSFLITDATCIKIIKSKMGSYTQEDSNLEQEIISACVSNMKNSFNYLSDHSIKMFRENDFNKFSQVLNSIQICRNHRKKHRSISSEEVR